jgi:hypothetical protein
VEFQLFFVPALCVEAYRSCTRKVWFCCSSIINILIGYCACAAVGSDQMASGSHASKNGHSHGSAAPSFGFKMNLKATSSATPSKRKNPEEPEEEEAIDFVVGFSSSGQVQRLISHSASFL